MATIRRVSGGEILQRYRIDQKLVLLGRDDSCDIVLKGPGISRRHCMLAQTAEGYCIEDLNSSNGTLLNGTRLAEKQVLSDNDRFIIMGHILEYATSNEELGATQGKAFAPEDLPTASKEYNSTQKMDPSELNRRLNALLEGEGLDFDDN